MKTRCSLGIAILITGMAAVDVCGQINQQRVARLSAERQNLVMRIHRDTQQHLKPRFRASLAQFQAVLGTPQGALQQFEQTRAAVQIGQRNLHALKRGERIVEATAYVLDFMFEAMGGMGAPGEPGSARRHISTREISDMYERYVLETRLRAAFLEQIVKIDQEMAALNRRLHFPNAPQQPAGHQWRF